MKQLLTILFLLISFVSFGQFPNNPTQSNDKTNTNFVGAATFQRGMLAGNFADTTAANLIPYMKGVPSILIHTADIDAYWFRNSAATKWIQIMPGGSASAQNPWIIGGNAGLFTSPVDPQYIGTKTAQGFGFMSNNTNRIILPSGGLNQSQVIGDTTLNKPMTYNTSTKEWGYAYWFGSGAGSSVTASNGLTKSSDDVKLGGTMTENTTINSSGFAFTFEDATEIVLASTGLSNSSIGLRVSIGDRLNEFSVGTDTTKINPPSGNLLIDTLANLSAQNTLMGWTSTSGADRGKAGYVTLGSGVSIDAGVLNVSVTTSPTQVRVVYVDSLYGNNSTAKVGDATKPFATLTRANDSLTTAGGVIYLGVGTYATATNWKANTTVIGAQMPYYDWTVTQTNDSQQVRTAPTRLVNGSIIRGTVALSNLGNMSFQNVGFDCGSAYVAGGGTEGDCVQYGVTGTLPYTTPPNISFKDCIFLGRTASSAFHGLLIEGANDVTIDNITTCFGTHGLAIKAVNVSIHNTKHYNHTTDAAIFKTDTRAAGKISYDDFFITSLDQTTTPVCGGVILQNNGVPFREVSITNGKISYAAFGMYNLGRVSNVSIANNVFRNIAFSGLNIDSSTNILVQNNIVQYCAAGYGIILRNGTNCFVANNILLGAAGGGVDLFLTGYDASNKTFYSDNVYVTSSIGANTTNTNSAGSFTAGSVLFGSGSAITENNTKLFWDNTNFYLGLGTGVPLAKIDAVGAGYTSLRVETTTAAGASVLFVEPTETWFVGARPDIAAGLLAIGNVSSGAKLTISSAGATTIADLAGTGTRMVEASSTGVLSATNAAPTSGTYTPTLDNTTNVSSSTPIVCHYIRVGNQVTVTGSVTLTTTAGGGASTVLGISLPIASNFAATTDGAGLGNATAPSSFTISSYIEGNTTSDRMELKFDAATIASGTVFFTFTYTVI